MTISPQVEWLNGYMLDTTEINAVVKGTLPISAIYGRLVFVTHVQLDEINKTPCEEKRAELQSAFKNIAPEHLATETFIVGVSQCGAARLSDGSTFAAMLARHKALNKSSKRRLISQTCDILIAETAIRNKLTLVSGDATLRQVTIEFGGQAIDREHFMSAI